MITSTVERVSANYKNLSGKFVIESTDYNKQYCSIYLARLKEMEILLRDRIQGKWGTPRKMYRNWNIIQRPKTQAVNIETISRRNQVTPQPILHHFTDDTDKLYMEDELQRYELLGVLDCKTLVTGITCALLGSDMGNGKFMVEDYLFANYRPQIEYPLINEDKYVIFLSGIDFINHHNFVSNLELLTNWVSGMLGDEDTVSRIVRIIIAGNSIRSHAEKKRITMMMTSRSKESPEAIEAVKNFDYFLLQLCELVDVDVMPGENDPSNHILPQRPMHCCMFPNSSVYKSLNLVTNPYFCSVDGIKIFGTSGQPVKNIIGYSEIADPIEAMECCLNWSHVAPTAPDTLGCYPFYEEDPFIISECPHVFFTGNQPEFKTKIAEGDAGQKVRLICIPEFSDSFQALVLNLKNLDCSSMVFTACK
ncbi:hypothetical protein NQ317_007286 [Molorchus minor]|uniref:DNA polymerase delta subunit 2 n=1 Tax=Molorchus minor TaxID=1323400 RepID=A0ABQ9JWC7_9CUCU|nr:hypothetical protein NQ317_007286 [Molorchus minor]